MCVKPSKVSTSSGAGDRRQGPKIQPFSEPGWELQGSTPGDPYPVQILSGGGWFVPKGAQPCPPNTLPPVSHTIGRRRGRGRHRAGRPGRRGRAEACTEPGPAGRARLGRAGKSPKGGGARDSLACLGCERASSSRLIGDPQLFPPNRAAAPQPDSSCGAGDGHPRAQARDLPPPHRLRAQAGGKGVRGGAGLPGEGAPFCPKLPGTQIGAQAGQ